MTAFLLLPGAGLVVPATAAAAPVSGLGADLVTSGYRSPVFLTHAPGEPENVYVVEQGGTVRAFDRGAELSATPFLTVPDVRSGGERGLLGLAFDPGYATNRLLYVNYTSLTGNTHIDRVDMSGLAPRFTPVMRIERSRRNHHGGFMAFSPVDNQLYVMTGDSGGGNDPDDRSQDLSSPLGKVLRIDPHGDAYPNDPDKNFAIPAGNPFADGAGGALDEIWAYGLRNPHRASFDRETGDLLIADVGQDAREEINVQGADSTGGENYGWPLREGSDNTPRVGGDRPDGNVDPAYEYTHGSGDFQGRAVVGGYVYRGPVEAFDGEYFFADFVAGRVWSFAVEDLETGPLQPSDLTDWTNVLIADGVDPAGITSFGEDSDGNLYFMNMAGDLYQLQAVPLPAAAWMFVGALAVLVARRRS